MLLNSININVMQMTEYNTYKSNHLTFISLKVML